MNKLCLLLAKKYAVMKVASIIIVSRVSVALRAI
jgi:hypothetical protein